VLAKTTRKNRKAALFLKWFTSPEQNVKFAMTTGYLPVQTHLMGSQDFEDVLDTLRKW
jgi:multiple sugar transport system substrate-binding protein